MISSEKGLKAKVAIVGNLGSKMHTVRNAKGHKIVKFSVARNDLDFNPNTASKWKTNWFNLYAYGHLANYVQGNLKKGQKVTISGVWVQRTEINKHGQKRQVKEVEVRAIEEMN